MELSDKLLGIQRLTGTIWNNASTISNDSGSLKETLERLLTGASTALRSAAPVSPGEAE